MRFVLVLLAVSTLGAFAQEQAPDRGWFVGLSVGAAKINESDGGYIFEPSDPYHADDSGNVFTVSGGYQFFKYFALEAGYVKVNEMTITAPEAYLVTEPEGFKLMAVGRLPLGESFAFVGKAGAFLNDSNDTEYRETGAYDANTDGGFAYEVGAEYRVAPHWLVNVTASVYDMDILTVFGPDRELQLLQAGVRYLF